MLLFRIVTENVSLPCHLAFHAVTDPAGIRVVYNRLLRNRDPGVLQDIQDLLRHRVIFLFRVEIHAKFMDDLLPAIRCQQGSAAGLLPYDVFVWGVLRRLKVLCLFRDPKKKITKFL